MIGRESFFLRSSHLLGASQSQGFREGSIEQLNRELLTLFVEDPVEVQQGVDIPKQDLEGHLQEYPPCPPKKKQTWILGINNRKKTGKIYNKQTTLETTSQKHLPPPPLNKKTREPRHFAPTTRPHKKTSFEPRKKKTSYFPLNPGWLIPGSLFHALK